VTISDKSISIHSLLTLFLSNYRST